MYSLHLKCTKILSMPVWKQLILYTQVQKKYETIENSLINTIIYNSCIHFFIDNYKK